MTNLRKPLKKQRALAYSHQNGTCFYCSFPIWNTAPHEFSSKYDITLPQTMQLRCTGEHLISHEDGGTAAKQNIVATCWFCNKQRHRRKTVPNPLQYKKLIQQRMSQGRWHTFELLSNTG